MSIAGWATPEGTARFRHRSGAVDDFFSTGPSGIAMSSLGVGTYRGGADLDSDRRYEASLRCALASGINVVDTAIKYRDQRSERTIGTVLGELFAAGFLRRDEVFVSTKGGIVPKSLHAGLDHCIEPGFLADQLERSLANLGLETVDCWFVHNPEQELLVSSRDAFYDRLRDIFAMLERQATSGRVRAYGLASWKGFRVPAGSRYLVDLARVHQIAFELAGDHHHFRFLQLPLSIGMPVVETLEVMRAARQLGLGVLTSGSLYEGKLEQLVNLMQVARHVGRHDSIFEPESLSVSLPQSGTSLVQLFELLERVRADALDLDEMLDVSAASGRYPRALDVVRSHPDVTCALFGCDDVVFVEANRALAALSKCPPEPLARLWSRLSSPRQSTVKDSGHHGHRP